MSSHAPQILPALLNAELADQLLTLADAAHAADGAEPFNDETKAQIRAGAQGEHPSATVIGAWSADGAGGMELTGVASSSTPARRSARSPCLNWWSIRSSAAADSGLR